MKIWIDPPSEKTMNTEMIYHPRLGFVPKSVPILDETEEEYVDIQEVCKTITQSL